MKLVKTLIIYFSFVIPIMAICLILIISGCVSVFYSGFAVDSSGVIYIGKDSKIEKYNNGKVIGVLNPKTLGRQGTVLCLDEKSAIGGVSHR